MPCEFFGPIRYTDGTQVRQWQDSCIASGRIPKWTGPWSMSGNNDVMNCYCCDRATDVPTDAAAREGEGATVPAESYLLTLTGEALTPLLDGEGVVLELGDGELELVYRRRREY